MTPLAAAVLAILWCDEREPSPILAPALDARRTVRDEAVELGARRRRTPMGDHEAAALRQEVVAVERWMRATPAPAAHPWTIHVTLATVLLAALADAPPAYARLSRAVQRLDDAMRRKMPADDYLAATRCADREVWA